VASDINIINRSTYSLLDCVGDIGGVLAFFATIVGSFVQIFSDYKLSTLLVAALFKWNEPFSVREYTQAVRNGENIFCYGMCYKEKKDTTKQQMKLNRKIKDP
jgi:hypothetical protein